MATRAKMGKTLGGAAPYGYKWQDGVLALEPTEPHVIPPGAEVYLMAGPANVFDVEARFPAVGSELVVRWPTADLRVDLVGADDGALPGATLVVDGRLIEGGPPPVRALGLGRGTHTVVASAPGYATQRHVVRLAEGQAVSREIVLRRLP
jgi:hypothetical protein